MRTKYLHYILDNGPKLKNCSTCMNAGNYFNNDLMLGDECSQIGVFPLGNYVCDLYEPHSGKLLTLVKKKLKSSEIKSAMKVNFREVQDETDN